MNKVMLQFLSIIFAGLLLSACGEPQTDADQSAMIEMVEPDPAAADATFQSLTGQAVELSDYAGKNIVLNYWATWCAPCIAELPSLERAADVLTDENYVFLLASDESLEDIRAFIDERGFNGNFIKLNGFFATQGVQAVPSTVLYNAQGEEVRSWLGDREWDSPEMLSELRDL